MGRATIRLRGRAALAAIACTGGAGIGALVAASASGSPAPCSDTSAACLEQVAMSYVGAIGSKDPAKADAIRAAADVQRWENGLHNVSTRAQLVAETKNTQLAVADIREVRLFPAQDGRNVFAMYLADGGLSRRASVTSHVIERIGISNGLIDQIEVVQCTGGPHETSTGTATDVTGVLDLAICVRANPAIPGRLGLVGLGG